MDLRSQWHAFATLVVLGGGSEAATAITDHMFVTLDQMRASRVPGAVPEPAA